ncbi:uncharacterized protein [Littorina saxatilis]|uniref:uncharacterized protein n=1 Tax=Littorina saxatilis TaxID=31220 RepID=UPI0038B63DB0
MPRLSAIDRERAIGQLQAGNRPAAIANVMGVATSTICRLWTRFQASGSTWDGARSGRPRVTTARQDRAIYRQHLRQPFLPATETSRNTVGTHGAPISGTTTRRRLSANHMDCRRPARRTLLTAQHRQQRLQWGHEHLNWNQRQWRDILFYGRKPLTASATRTAASGCGEDATRGTPPTTSCNTTPGEAPAS